MPVVVVVVVGVLDVRQAQLPENLRGFLVHLGVGFRRNRTVIIDRRCLARSECRNEEQDIIMGNHNGRSYWKSTHKDTMMCCVC